MIQTESKNSRDYFRRTIVRLNFLLSALFFLSFSGVALAAKQVGNMGIVRLGALESFASNDAIDADRLGAGAVAMNKKAASSPAHKGKKPKASTLKKTNGKKVVRKQSSAL